MIEKYEVADPLFIAYEEGDHLICRVHKRPGLDYRHFAMAAADLVRHIARAFNVEEVAVWHAVLKERDNPTTEVRSGV